MFYQKALIEMIVYQFFVFKKQEGFAQQSLMF
jgi:hypothetical protein